MVGQGAIEKATESIQINLIPKEKIPTKMTSKIPGL